MTYKDLSRHRKVRTSFLYGLSHWNSHSMYPLAAPVLILIHPLKYWPVLPPQPLHLGWKEQLPLEKQKRLDSSPQHPLL